MSETFDPYHKWLGIPPADQPPNHYRLLGIPRFETDPDVIANAADQRMAHIRSFQTGEHSALSQNILNEIAAARVSLLDAEKKTKYDAALKRAEAAKKLPKATALEPPPVQPPPVETDKELDLEGFTATLPHHPHPQRQRKVPWQAWASVGAAAVGLLIIGIFVLMGSNKEEKATVKTGEQVAVKPKPDKPEPSPAIKDAEKPSETPTDSKPEPQPITTNSEQEHNDATSDDHKPPLGPETVSKPEDTPAVETPKKAEERLKQALADAKTPEDFRTVAQDSLKVFEQAVAGGQTDLSKRIATIALVAARKAKDGTLAFDAAFCYVAGHRRAGSADEGEEEETDRPAASGLSDTSDAGKLSTSHDGTAAAKPGKDGWIVIFRSSDPSIWNTDVNNSKDDFAISLSKVPDGIQYLRMRAVGQQAQVIIPIEKAKLDSTYEHENYGWNGTNKREYNANHLGIYRLPILNRASGEICIFRPGSGGDAWGKGYGFGHRAWLDDRQGYTWNGVEISQTVFEIAVKVEPLTRREQPDLLQEDKVSLTAQTNSPGQSQSKNTARAKRIDKIVLWNQHNSLDNNHGTKVCNVTLFRGERQLWRSNKLEVPWAPNKDTFLAVRVPHIVANKVRIDITEWYGRGGGLSEVEVFSGKENIARNCRAIASGEVLPGDPRSASTLTDGITSSSQGFVGYWLLPIQQPGWAEIYLEE